MRAGSQKELEKRRLRAGRLLAKGRPQVEVAREVGVCSTTVSRWAQMLVAGGLTALKTQRARARPAGLRPRAAPTPGTRAQEWKHNRWPALKNTPENAVKPSSSSTSRD